MNNRSFSAEKSAEKFNENHEFLENGIETGNPEVKNNTNLSALNISCDKSQPSCQENETNPEKQNVFQESYLNTNFTNDPRILFNIQSLTSMEYQSGKEGLFQVDDKEINNGGNSQVSDLNYENMQRKNSESGNKVPCLDVSSKSRSNTLPGDLNTFIMDSVCHRKRIASSDEALKDRNQGPKRSKNEILTFSNQYYESDSKEGSMSHDFSWEKSVKNQMVFQGNRMTGIHGEIQNTENSTSFTQGMQDLCNGGKNTHFTYGQIIATNSSFSDNDQNDHGLTKISDPMTSNYSRENRLEYGGHGNVNNPYMCNEKESQSMKVYFSLTNGMPILHDVGNNSLFASGQTISENTSISEIPPKDDELSKISDSMASEHFRKNMLAVSVSTDYHSNENNPNVLGDTSLSLYEAKKGEVLCCKVCKSNVSNHKYTYEGSFHYDCCICTFNDTDPNKLHSHSYDHVPHQVCNICSKEHTEGDSHEGAKQCFVIDCNQILKCRTQLNEHYLLNHVVYFYDRCWSCLKGFKEHYINYEGKSVYACCLCEEKSTFREWVQHAGTHRPNLFCTSCKEEFPGEETNSHKKEFMCIVCKQNFMCKGLFEQHDDHEVYFLTNCRVCNKEISEHKIYMKNIFKCCKCPKVDKYTSKFRRHLYTHFEFKVYKCDTCELRFKRRLELDGHSESCPAVPFKCVGCKAKFPSQEFLDLHCSVKHQV